MFAKMLNAEICKFQSALVAKYGDTMIVTQAIREFTARCNACGKTSMIETHKAAIIREFAL